MNALNPVVAAGAVRGFAAATWAAPSSEAEADRILDQFANCDFDVPAWLSGEWAGESLSEIAAEIPTDAPLDPGGPVWQDAYCEAADEAFETELSRACLALLEP